MPPVEGHQARREHHRFAVRDLDTTELATPNCPDCGRSMKSAGAGQGTDVEIRLPIVVATAVPAAADDQRPAALRHDQHVASVPCHDTSHGAHMYQRGSVATSTTARRGAACSTRVSSGCEVMA